GSAYWTGCRWRPSGSSVTLRRSGGSRHPRVGSVRTRGASDTTPISSLASRSPAGLKGRTITSESFTISHRVRIVKNSSLIVAVRRRPGIYSTDRLECKPTGLHSSNRAEVGQDADDAGAGGAAALPSSGGTMHHLCRVFSSAARTGGPGGSVPAASP